MGKSKAQAKTSPSTEQSTSYSESLFEEIWAKIQLKLNEWIENTLPPIIIVNLYDVSVTGRRRLSLVHCKPMQSPQPPSAE